MPIFGFLLSHSVARDYRILSETKISLEKEYSAFIQSKKSYEVEELNNQLKNEIEERFAVKELLASTNNKLDSIINNSTALISLKHIDDRYDLVNDTFLKCLGVNDNDIIGKTDREVFSSDNADMIYIDDAEILKTGDAIHYEEVLPTQDGDRHYLCVKFPLYSSGNKIYRIFSICTDITEGLKAQNEVLHLAQYDTLTGLPNRSLFLDKLTQ